MTTFRAPKGWKFVGTTDASFGSTETRVEKFRREERFRNAIRNITSEKIEELKKHADEAYEIANINNTQLLQAFNDKKLKSKALIKKAKALKKNRLNTDTSEIAVV